MINRALFFLFFLFSASAHAVAPVALYIAGSTVLHGAVLAIHFSDNAANDGQSSPDGSGLPSSPLTVNINPTHPVPTPAGWTAPASGQVQPTPPSSSATSLVYSAAFSPNSGTGSTADDACKNAYAGYAYKTAASVCPLGSQYAYFTNAFASGPRCMGTSVACSNGAVTVLDRGAITSQNSCPSGYVLSGSSCVLSNPAVVPKPADQLCPMIRDTVSNTFAPDSNDPDCDGVAANSNNGTPVNLNPNLKGTFTSQNIKIERSDGTVTTYQLLSNGGSQVQSMSYNAATDRTEYTTLQFSPPSPATGAVTVDGKSSSSIPGGGTLTGASPSVGGTGGAGGLTNGGSNGTGATGTGTGSGSGGAGTFPSDYSRSGEAQAAADGLGTKLDTLHDDLSKTNVTEDPVLPVAADMPGWGSSFSALSGFSLPSHVSVCPQPQMDLSFLLGTGHVYTMNSHCSLFADNAVVIQNSMILVFSILALFIVLSA